MTTTPTSSTQELRDSLEIFEIDSTTKFSWATLRMLLPDVETALFFAKVYDIDYSKLGKLLEITHDSTVLQALTNGAHSTELQDYIVDVVPDDVLVQAQVQWTGEVPKGEILPELWAAAQVEIAQSLKDVAGKIKHTLDKMPSKEGSMIFQHMSKINKQRPTVGTYGPRITHDPVPENLVIFDDSGSMTENTVRQLMPDVVAMSWAANAHLVLVSETARYWAPGTYSVNGLLEEAEFWGTHYETLVPILKDRAWGTVITIADYDSSWSAKTYLKNNVKNASIEQLFDVSLVDRPTFLAECVGQFAEKVTPLLIGNSYRVTQ